MADPDELNMPHNFYIPPPSPQVIRNRRHLKSHIHPLSNKYSREKSSNSPSKLFLGQSRYHDSGYQGNSECFTDSSFSRLRDHSESRYSSPDIKSPLDFNHPIFKLSDNDQLTGNSRPNFNDIETKMKILPSDISLIMPSFSNNGSYSPLPTALNTSSSTSHKQLFPTHSGKLDCANQPQENSFSDCISNNSEREDFMISPPRLSFRNLNLFDKSRTPLNSGRAFKRKSTYSSAEYSKNIIDGNDILQSTPLSDKRKFFKPYQLNPKQNPLSKDALHKQIVWMRESQAVRYYEEFIELECLGSGHFGNVFKCINRLDGCLYAVKKSKAPFNSSFKEYAAIKEVCAHAVLGNHPHIVRYYSAWAEDGTVFIQNEYCNGGTLSDVIKRKGCMDKCIPESELKMLLVHVSRGLKYFHALGLVHLDIKPSNIFVTRRSPPAVYNNSDEGFESDEEKFDATIYKIGDLGLVTSLYAPEVEEGDCRYLPYEILQEDYSDLTKADIFSLGMSVYEAASHSTIHPNGDEWQNLRNGKIPFLNSYSRELNTLIKEMLHPVPKERPSALCLIRHPALCPLSSKTRLQLKKELNAERFKNQILTKKLEEAENENQSYKRQCENFNSYHPGAPVTSIIVNPFAAINLPVKKRLIGTGVKRSLSVKDF